MTDFYQHYLSRGKWESWEAALLFNGKDPRLDKDKVQLGAVDDFSGTRQGTWQWKVKEYYAIFEHAAREDWLKSGADVDPYFYWREYKNAPPTVFIELARIKNLNVPAELFPKGESINDFKDSDFGQEGDAGNGLPPITVVGLAKLFPINKNTADNLNEWKDYARNASRNELIECRVTIGGGPAKSTFDVLAVAQWLHKREIMLWGESRKKIRANYPDYWDDYGDD